MKKISTMYLIIVGFAFILWADAVCDFLKLDVAPGTIKIFALTTVILGIAYLENEKRVKKIMMEQLG